MKVELHTVEESRQQVIGMIQSGDWWVFPYIGGASNRGMESLLSDLDDRGLTDRDDPVLVHDIYWPLGSCPVLRTLLIHKRCYSRTELLGTLGVTAKDADSPYGPPPNGHEQDIVFLPDPVFEPFQRVFMEAFAIWFHPDEAA